MFHDMNRLENRPPHCSRRLRAVGSVSIALITVSRMLQIGVSGLLGGPVDESAFAVDCDDANSMSTVSVNC